MSTYGYEIVQTLIVDIEPDEHVKRAMNEINAGESQLVFFFSSCHCMIHQNYLLLFLTAVFHCCKQLLG